MTESSGTPRIPAVNLWVTFRHDGAFLLELLADWYTLLGAAESHVDDVEGTARILTPWASRSRTTDPMQRFVGRGPTRSEVPALRSAYSRGLELGVVNAPHRTRAMMGRSRDDDHLFGELFGSAPPNSAELLDTMTKRLSRQLGRYFRRNRAKAHERLADGSYLPVLQHHLARCRSLSTDPHAYSLLEHSLLEIIEDERYLRIAENERARQLVAQLDDEVSRLYGRCMDVER